MTASQTEPVGDIARKRASLKWPVALLVLIAFLTWRVTQDFTFWRAALQQGTLLPSQNADGALLQTGQGPPRFDLKKLTIPREEIRRGGPPKDGIPALTRPKFVAAAEARFLKGTDRVAGVSIDDDARAYPLAILNYHEIVNDVVGKTPVAVTYCPLCDSVAVFDRRTPLGERKFGVSGLLYNSNVLMYDRKGTPESLWSQLRTRGVSGPAADQALKVLPVELTSWDDWRSRHPTTRVLSAATGHNRDYTRDPYAGYLDSPQLMFPAQPSSDRLPPKARVLGVWADKVARAYPLSAFSHEQTTLKDSLEGKQFTLTYNADAQSLRVSQADEGVNWVYSLWFAWYAFRPETEVFAR